MFLPTPPSVPAVYAPWIWASTRAGRFRDLKAFSRFKRANLHRLLRYHPCKMVGKAPYKKNSEHQKQKKTVINFTCNFFSHQKKMVNHFLWTMG